MTFVARPSGLLVPEEAAPRLVGLDLFAGAGGFSLGMEYGGIDVVCAVERWFPAMETYLTNLGAPDCRLAFDSPATEADWRTTLERRRKKPGRILEHPEPPEPGWIGWNRPRLAAGDSDDEFGGRLVGLGCRSFYCGDVAKVSGAELLELARVDHFDVVFGGPPCQGLSTANPKACIEDPRNAMLWEFLRFVEELRPKAFIIENVPPLLTVANGGLFKALCKRANAAGYDVVANIVDAANYGVPQRRRRAIIVGTVAGSRIFQFPMPNHWARGQRADGESWDMLSVGPDFPPDARDDGEEVDFDVDAKRFKRAARRGPRQRSLFDEGLATTGPAPRSGP